MAVLAYEFNLDRKHIIEKALSVTSDISFQNDAKAFLHELSNNQYDIILVNVDQGNGKKFDLLEKIADTPHQFRLLSPVTGKIST